MLVRLFRFYILFSFACIGTEAGVSPFRRLACSDSVGGRLSPSAIAIWCVCPLFASVSPLSTLYTKAGLKPRIRDQCAIDSPFTSNNFRISGRERTFIYQYLCYLVHKYKHEYSILYNVQQPSIFFWEVA